MVVSVDLLVEREVLVALLVCITVINEVVVSNAVVVLNAVIELVWVALAVPVSVLLDVDRDLGSNTSCAPSINDVIQSVTYIVVVLISLEV